MTPVLLLALLACGTEDKPTELPPPPASDEEFNSAIKALSPVEQTTDIDIDKTIRVVHEIDTALTKDMSVSDYLKDVQRQDYRNVDPEVMEARKKILELQFAIYAKQTEMQDRQDAWDTTAKLLTAASVVEAKGGVTPIGAPAGGFAIDREQAQRLLQQQREDALAARKLKDEQQALELQLFDAVSSYSTVYWDKLETWDRLCGHRDRAYLAAKNGDWDTVIAASDEAIKMAPHEKEAHLLKAMALIERGDPEDLSVARAMLDDYVREHPSEDAPALLLLGVVMSRQGNAEQAKLTWQESAAHYPKQGEALTDMLDPYEMRSWLRKSREGGTIVEQYQAMMLGAGYFSPDLEMAKAEFAKGDTLGGRSKVMDHFARRRSEAAASNPEDQRKLWGFILQDIDYAQRVLGPDFRDIFPEDGYLDLVVAPTTLYPNREITVAVNNRSANTLHNATLLLVVHFTDMHPADYEPFAAPKTMPAVKAGETTDFGTMEVVTTLWGTEKGVSDIVQQRAVLLTDEAVIWVDTDEFKIAEAKEFRDALKNQLPKPEQKTAWHQQMVDGLSSQAEGLGTKAKVEVKPNYGFADDVKITLPGALTVFKPVFTLKYGGQAYKASTNVVNDDQIELVFDGVGAFDGGEAAKGDMVLEMNSVYGNFSTTWKPDGPMEWDFSTTQPEK